MMMMVAAMALHQTVGRLETRPVARSAFSFGGMVFFKQFGWRVFQLPRGVLL